jgi:5-aminolevulinate synthase
MLLEDHGIYVQAINYPTVPRGEECLRITPTPGHIKEYRDHLIQAVDAVWKTLDLKRTSEWKAIGGFIGVGVEGAEAKNAPIWDDTQLGLEDGETVEDAVEREMQAGLFEKEQLMKFQDVVPSMKTSGVVSPNPLTTMPTIGVSA